jgi:hypothetical protein
MCPGAQPRTVGLPNLRVIGLPTSRFYDTMASLYLVLLPFGDMTLPVWGGCHCVRESCLVTGLCHCLKFEQRQQYVGRTESGHVMCTWKFSRAADRVPRRRGSFGRGRGDRYSSVLCQL